VSHTSLITDSEGCVSPTLQAAAGQQWFSIDTMAQRASTAAGRTAAASFCEAVRRQGWAVVTLPAAWALPSKLAAVHEAVRELFDLPQGACRPRLSHLTLDLFHPHSIYPQSPTSHCLPPHTRSIPPSGPPQHVLSPAPTHPPHLRQRALDGGQRDMTPPTCSQRKFLSKSWEKVTSPKKL
jgi:hypothetical protein